MYSPHVTSEDVNMDEPENYDILSHINIADFAFEHINCGQGNQAALPKNRFKNFGEPLTIFSEFIVQCSRELRDRFQILELSEVDCTQYATNPASKTALIHNIEQEMKLIITSCPNVTEFRVHYHNHLSSIIFWKAIEDNCFIFGRNWSKLKTIAVIQESNNKHLETSITKTSWLSKNISRVKERLEKLEIVVYVYVYDYESTDILLFEKSIEDYSRFPLLKTVNFATVHKAPFFGVKCFTDEMRHTMIQDFGVFTRYKEEENAIHQHPVSNPSYGGNALKDVASCLKVKTVNGDILWRHPDSLKYFMKRYPSVTSLYLNCDLDAYSKHYLQYFTMLPSTPRQDMVTFIEYVLGSGDFEVSDLYSDSPGGVISDLLSNPLVGNALTIRHQVVTHIEDVNRFDSSCKFHRVRAKPYFALKSKSDTMEVDGDLNQWDQNVLTLNLAQNVQLEQPQEQQASTMRPNFRNDFQDILSAASKGLKDLTFVGCDNYGDVYLYMCSCVCSTHALETVPNSSRKIWPLLLHDIFTLAQDLKSVACHSTNLGELESVVADTSILPVVNRTLERLCISDSVVDLQSLSTFVNLRLPNLKHFELMGCQYSEYKEVFDEVTRRDLVRAELNVRLPALSLEKFTFSLPSERLSMHENKNELLIRVRVYCNSVDETGEMGEFEWLFKLGQTWSPISTSIQNPTENETRGSDYIDLSIHCIDLKEIRLIGKQVRGTAEESISFFRSEVV